MFYIALVRDTSIDDVLIFTVEAHTVPDARLKVKEFYANEGWERTDIGAIIVLDVLDAEVCYVGKASATKDTAVTPYKKREGYRVYQRDYYKNVTKRRRQAGAKGVRHG